MDRYEGDVSGYGGGVRIDNPVGQFEGVVVGGCALWVDGEYMSLGAFGPRGVGVECVGGRGGAAEGLINMLVHFSVMLYESFAIQSVFIIGGEVIHFSDGFYEDPFWVFADPLVEFEKDKQIFGVFRKLVGRGGIGDYKIGECGVTQGTSIEQAFLIDGSSVCAIVF
jgi:hypothetical protein